MIRGGDARVLAGQGKPRASGDDPLRETGAEKAAS